MPLLPPPQKHCSDLQSALNRLEAQLAEAQSDKSTLVEYLQEVQQQQGQQQGGQGSTADVAQLEEQAEEAQRQVGLGGRATADIDFWLLACSCVGRAGIVLHIC